MNDRYLSVAEICTYLGVKRDTVYKWISKKKLPAHRIGKLEFLKATSKDSPIARFIDKKGSGMHHIALVVDHLQPALDYLQEKGIELIDEKPRIGAEGFSIAFIHPKSTGGILVELCEKKK